MNINNSSSQKNQELQKTILAELRALRQEIKATSKRLLPIPEAAAYLGISPKTIRNGLGPRAAKPFPVKAVRLGGRVLFRREDLDQYVDRLGVRDDNG